MFNSILKTLQTGAFWKSVGMTAIGYAAYNKFLKSQVHKYWA